MRYIFFISVKLLQNSITFSIELQCSFPTDRLNYVCDWIRLDYFSHRLYPHGRRFYLAQEKQLRSLGLVKILVPSHFRVPLSPEK